MIGGSETGQVQEWLRVFAHYGMALSSISFDQTDI